MARQHFGEQHAAAAGDVAHALDLAEGIGARHAGRVERGQRAHGGGEDGALLGVAIEPVPHRHAVHPLEGVLARGERAIEVGPRAQVRRRAEVLGEVAEGAGAARAQPGRHAVVGEASVLAQREHADGGERTHHALHGVGVAAGARRQRGGVERAGVEEVGDAQPRRRAQHLRLRHAGGQLEQRQLRRHQRVGQPQERAAQAQHDLDEEARRQHRATDGARVHGPTLITAASNTLETI